MNTDLRMNLSAERPDSPFQRAIFLSSGRSGQIDLIEAHKWFNIAAAGATVPPPSIATNLLAR